MAPEASCSLPYDMGLCRGHVGHVWLVCFDGSMGVNICVKINVHTYDSPAVMRNYVFTPVVKAQTDESHHYT